MKAGTLKTSLQLLGCLGFPKGRGVFNLKRYMETMLVAALCCVVLFTIPIIACRSSSEEVLLFSVSTGDALNC